MRRLGPVQSTGFAVAYVGTSLARVAAGGLQQRATASLEAAWSNISAANPEAGARMASEAGARVATVPVERDNSR